MNILNFFLNRSASNEKKRHLPFQPFIIWCAIIVGLFGGFATGSYLVFVLAYNIVPDKTFSSLVQVHGHLQLIGWTGFFIIGVSLYKMPRLMSCKPLQVSTSYLILSTLILGLLSRTFGQVLAHHFISDQAFLRYAVVVGCLLETIGILVFVYVLFPKLIKYHSKPGAYAAASLKPFLIVSFSGWLVYAVTNVVLAVLFANSSSLIIDPTWNNIATNIYVYLVLLPTCFAFSISTFPIFLRLRAPTWPVSYIALTYSIGTVFHLVCAAAIELHLSNVILQTLLEIGICIRVGAIIWLILEMDLLRIYDPWFTKFRGNTDRENRPPRKYAGDFGQFGKFEYLIYAAYFWLVVASLTEFISHFANIGISSTIIRHFYLLGFVTHLILGMAARMIPGFLGRSRVAFPQLVLLSFILITISILGRTFPLIFSVTNQSIFRFVYGFSGLFAILAILSLGINLAATVRQDKIAREMKLAEQERAEQERLASS